MKRGRAAFVYGIMAWVFVWLLFLGFCLDVRCFLVISYIVVFNIFFHDFIIGGSTRYFSCCWNRMLDRMGARSCTIFYFFYLISIFVYVVNNNVRACTFGSGRLN